LNYPLYYTQNPQKYQSLFAKFSVLRKKACFSPAAVPVLPLRTLCGAAFRAAAAFASKFSAMSVKKQGFSSGLCLVHSGIFQYNKEAEKKNKRCDRNGLPRCFVFCGAAAPGEKRSAVQ